MDKLNSKGKYTVSKDILNKIKENFDAYFTTQDECKKTIKEAFENDISLRSEFVRLALQDDSLSESERNRLISCGWNALNGREVSAE